MTFDRWFARAGLPAEQIDLLRRKWSFLLTKGLTTEQISCVFDAIVGASRAEFLEE